MLAVWPVVTMILFILLPAHRALIWSVLGAYLVLPVRTVFEIPGVPPLDKTTISNLSILVCCILFVREKWSGALKEPVLVILAVIFTFSPFFTAFFNPEGLLYADRLIPAMTMYDALAQAAINAISLIPFVAAYSLIDSDPRRWQVIMILVLATLAYSVFMLIEVRLSPQLHRLVYGFFPHSFGQQMRAGGFRPVVFLGHGLLVAIFCATAVICAIAQWRQARGGKRTRSGIVVLYLTVILVLCKSLGAILLTSVLGPLLATMRAKRVAALSSMVCIAILAYPVVRSSGMIPIATVSQMASSLSDDRAGSFSFRLANEDQLLQRAAEKPVLGWGSWGRNRIYSAEDGRDLSITDGAWIIVLGTWGWAGYLSMFGLLCFGCVRILWKSRIRNSISLASATLCVVLSLNLLDSIPNDSIRPVTWLLAGAVFAISLKPLRRRTGKMSINSCQWVSST